MWRVRSIVYGEALAWGLLNPQASEGIHLSTKVRSGFAALLHNEQGWDYLPIRGRLPGAGEISGETPISLH